MQDARQAGDLSAAQLFREHGLFVARFLYRLGVPAQAIDDAVQDVFLVVHQRGGYRPGPAKPTTYLALIASRAASAQRRQQRLRSARQDARQPEELQADDDDPALRVQRQDDLSRLQEALSQLDPTLRETLLLAEFEDETAPAIAHAMGVPVGTVYWRLHEARKKFQRALVVTDRSRAQAAAARLPQRQRAARGVTRGAKLSAIFGLSNWEEVRERIHTARDVSVELDLSGALQRHLERVAALPAPSPPLPRAGWKLSFNVGPGTLAIGAAVAAIGVLAARELLPATAPVTNPEQVARAVAPLPAAPEPPEAAQAVADEPVSTGMATTHVVGPETNADLAADARARRPAHGSANEAPRSSAARATSFGAGAVAAIRARAHAQVTDGAREAAPAALPDDPPPDLPPEPGERSADAAPEARPERAELPKPTDPDALREARALARAASLLSTEPAQALAILESLPHSAQHAYLTEERDYIQVMALYGVGRRAQANRAAERFLTRYRSSVFRERVSAARKTAAP